MNTTRNPVEEEESDPHPVCASCGSTMNDRQADGWFCPGCAEYSRHLPVIYPSSPAHPTFERRAKNDPRILVGCEVASSPFNSRDSAEMEFLGRIVEADDTWVTIEENHHLFHTIAREIQTEKLFDHIETVDHPPNRGDSIPEGFALVVR